MVGEPRRHRRSAGPPQLGCTRAVGGYRLWQGLAYAGMGQAEIIIAVEHGQLLPQPVFALAQRADSSPDRSDMLADVQIDALHKARVDVPTQGDQEVIDGLQRANTTRCLTSTRRRRRTVFTACA